MLKQKMAFSYFFIVLPLLPIASASSYQFIRFVKPGVQTPPAKATPPKPENSRTARSFYHPHPIHYFENSENLVPDIFHLPPTSVIDFSYVPKELTQFSHDLSDYQDPLLLTGNAARAAVRFLYARSLFFSDYPHVRALLKNQDKRQRNGLAGHRLGSLRLNSPFLIRTGFTYSSY